QSANTRGIAVDANGNVEIGGAPSSGQPLRVREGGTGYGYVQDNANSGGAVFAITTTDGLAGGVGLYTTTNHALRLGTKGGGNNSAINLYPDGNNSWIGNLEVTGLVRSDSGGFKFPDGSVQTTAATGGTGFWSANGSNIYSNNSGSVGIGTS